MSQMSTPRKRGIRWMRYLAVIVALLWAGFWTFFGLASGISEGLSPVGILHHSIFPGLIFLISAIIAWRWNLVGGILLVLESLFVFVVYPMRFMDFPLITILLVLATMALPPMIAGILFIVSYKSTKSLKKEVSL
jgi:hypothetical protein